MRRSLAIALNTFKETIRDRVLSVIVVFALAMIVGEPLAGQHQPRPAGAHDEGLRSCRGHALRSHRGRVRAATLVRKEIEKRTVFVIFSKPVGRGEFIFGKFLGLCLTMAVVMAGMALFLFAVSWWVSKDATPLLLLAAALVYLQLVVVMALTVFFSTMTSAVLATVLGVCAFVAGELSANVLSLTEMGETHVLKAVAWVVFVHDPQSWRRRHQGRRRRRAERGRRRRSRPGPGTWSPTSSWRCSPRPRSSGARSSEVSPVVRRGAQPRGADRLPRRRRRIPDVAPGHGGRGLAGVRTLARPLQNFRRAGASRSPMSTGSISSSTTASTTRRLRVRVAAGVARPGHRAQPALGAPLLFGAYALLDLDAGKGDPAGGYD